MCPTESSAVAVSTVQVQRNRSGSSSSRVGSRQISYRPAIAITPPSAGRMKNGCFSGLPALVFCSVGYHSKYPSAGSRHRRGGEGRREGGLSWAGSLPAVVIFFPLDRGPG